jgi:hypothetical protein
LYLLLYLLLKHLVGADAIFAHVIVRATDHATVLIITVVLIAVVMAIFMVVVDTVMVDMA